MSNLHKKWLDSKVQHLIYQNPESSNIRENEIIENPNTIRFLNGENYAMYIMAGFFLFFIFIFILMDLFSENGSFNKESLFFYSILILVVFLLCLYGYTLPKKKYVYNRLEGEVTIPPKFYGKHSTFAFKNAKLFWFGDGAASGALRVEMFITAPDKKVGVLAIAGCANTIENLSFIVWYMDKNRPLPPDPIFDPYRQEDFERRKKEGFPPPLYLSQIPTPEATSEQQTEREKYWKDEDYFGKSTSAWL